MKRSLIFAAVAASVSALVSCESMNMDDSMNVTPAQKKAAPQKQVTRGFEESYPDARDIEWEFEHGCWVVSFETGRGAEEVEYEVWYDTDGNWLMTKREFHVSAVPQPIIDALSADPEFGSARLDDSEVEYYETPSGNFYRFEIVHNGREVEVDVTEGGVVTPAGKR